MSLLNRELDYFLTICETRNLARAADVLGVSQPALTRSLQRLEARFSARLFIRAPRGVELTPIGTALRARIENARITLNDAEREVAQMGAGKIGKVRIGAGNLVVHLVTRALFPRFTVERPAAQVQVHVAFNAELFDLVATGNLDFALCGIQDIPRDLAFHELFASELVVIVRTGHPLTKLKRPTARDLAAFGIAAPGADVPGRQAVEKRLTKIGVLTRPHAIESNSHEAILDAVATTDLFSLAPRHLALRHGWQPRIVPVEVAELDIQTRYGVLTRIDAYLSPLARRAIELIELELADAVREEPVRKVHASRSLAR
jgi:DNA-binding transcriptional LysR family regulator